MKDEILPLIRRGAVLWLVIIGAEFLHGAARVVFLEPLAGDFRARQIGVFSGIAIILAISYLFIPKIRAVNNLQLLLVGWLWVALTASFEIAFGRLLGLSWERILSDYDLTRGGLMGFGLAGMFFAPLIAAKLREKFSRRSRVQSVEGS